MSPVSARAGKKEPVAWSDALLVKECLAGNEEAWSALIDKYKALIYSIPVKYGLPPQEAADVFQATCTELLVRLPELREPRALPKLREEAGAAGGQPRCGSRLAGAGNSGYRGRVGAA